MIECIFVRFWLQLCADSIQPLCSPSSAHCLWTSSTPLSKLRELDSLFKSVNASTLDPAEKASRNLKTDKFAAHEIVIVCSYTRILRIMKLISHPYNGKKFNEYII
ncbi:hypothetical protein DL96DRAFT_1719592 [Flagelloscypha sp. PMI_526]|nr:hypothetical protein DL96DRAFT_1719592 [Flagelloscypha sp. PMI_526]